MTRTLDLGVGAGERWSRVGLIVLYGFVIVSLIGYATFGLNPVLLARFPSLAGFYAISFHFFAQAQVWLATLVLFVFLRVYAGYRWVTALIALYAISLGAELMGTTVGIPFGEYVYTSALGPKWFDHVPILIPFSWFYMAVPSYAVARRLTKGRIVPTIGVASLLLLAWDLALDPAMSGATAYWVWAQPGAYYGMPWLNLFGWYVTGLALMGALAWLRADAWMDDLPLRWLAGFYGANLLLPVGMAAAAGLWGAVVATFLSFAAVYGAARWFGGRSAAVPAPVRVPG